MPIFCCPGPASCALNIAASPNTATRPLGWKRSPEAIAKVVEALKSRPKEFYEKVAEKTRGQKRSPEFCKKLGERSKGKVLSEETKAKIREARSKQVITEEHKRKLSEAAKKQWARQKGELSSLEQ